MIVVKFGAVVIFGYILLVNSQSMPAPSAVFIDINDTVANVEVTMPEKINDSPVVKIEWNATKILDPALNDVTNTYNMTVTEISNKTSGEMVTAVVELEPIQPGYQYYGVFRVVNEKGEESDKSEPLEFPNPPPPPSTTPSVGPIDKISFSSLLICLLIPVIEFMGQPEFT